MRLRAGFSSGHTFELWQKLSYLFFFFRWFFLGRLCLSLARNKAARYDASGFNHTGERGNLYVRIFFSAKPVPPLSFGCWYASVRFVMANRYDPGHPSRGVRVTPHTPKDPYLRLDDYGHDDKSVPPQKLPSRFLVSSPLGKDDQSAWDPCASLQRANNVFGLSVWIMALVTHPLSFLSAPIQVFPSILLIFFWKGERGGRCAAGGPERRLASAFKLPARPPLFLCCSWPWPQTSPTAPGN